MLVLKSIGSTVSLVSVLIALVLVGMLLFVWPKTRRFAKHWLLWVTGAYVVFGLPVVANAIARSLPAVTSPQVPQPVRALIVLDGDNRRGRLRETLRIIRTDAPQTVWISGGEWFFEELKAAGYNRDSFGHETQASNTREQVAWVARIAGEHPGTRVTVVVSRLQAPRVAALAEATALDVALLISPIDDEPPTSGWRTWVPSYIALRTSRDAIYEHAALWHYSRKHWIDRD